MRRGGQIAVVLALCLSVGLHWCILQSIAWAGMVVNYARDTSISEAIQKTFDGKHPCALCKAIQKGKQAGRNQESNFSKKRLDPCVKLELPALYFPSPPGERCVLDCFSATRSEIPPVPPPKSV